MTRIQVTFVIDDEFADPDHEMGVTDQGFGLIHGALDESVGADDLHVKRVDE